MRKVSRVANACQIRSSECGEKTRKRVWGWRLAVLPRRERRGYYRCAGSHGKLKGISFSVPEEQVQPISISPGIHAGVHAALPLVFSPVYGASRSHATSPQAIH